MINVDTYWRQTSHQYNHICVFSQS